VQNGALVLSGTRELGPAMNGRCRRGSARIQAAPAMVDDACINLVGRRESTMIRTSLMTGVLVLTTGFGGLAPPTPAAAGDVSIAITPKGKQATAIRDGLRVLSWAQHMRNQARIDQKGGGNGAGISQSGNGNWAGILQRGRGHSATVTQNGDNNAFGIFQFGRNTSTNAAQTGNGQVGLVLQAGW
jgi:hypothetical protein